MLKRLQTVHVVTHRDQYGNTWANVFDTPALAETYADNLRTVPGAYSNVTVTSADLMTQAED